MIKYFYLIHKWDPNSYYHSGSMWIREYDNDGIVSIPQKNKLERKNSKRHQKKERKKEIKNWIKKEWNKIKEKTNKK